MPFTPFHIGPGLAMHALAPRRIGFIPFCLVNVLVDVEPLWFLIAGQPPLHRFFHTLLGASLVIGAVVAGYAVVRWMNGRRRSQDRREGGRPTHLPVVVGAVLGGGSHILLDCIMHHDIRPFAPFSMANPLLGLMSTAALHWWCLATGGIGLAVLAVRRLIGRS